MITYYEEPFKEQAHIHSLDGEIEEITILGETMQGQQKVFIVDYNGIRCTAIFNCFTGSYYADDKFGVINNCI